ncbi:hypothetical protein G7Y89_g12340 [Cudoniella acicularis]|uniref:Peptidase A1 domain-containing protein n=1 Tax=Cudoniella acicularis TaxID=354080 RepID=A0A8H4RBL3_9HELO|nr:hypothetical protein G7Y89_g12340 [Cudoniella acicularis]
MFIIKNFIAVVALASIVQASYFYFPEYRCALNEGCSQSKRSAAAETLQPDFTLKLVQRVPENDIPRDLQIRKLANRLKRKYQGPFATLVEGVEDRGLGSKRTNTYSIVSAAAPSQTNSAGIDQDGTDFSYFAQVFLGSASTPMYMLLDTGAGTSWVMGPSCTSAPCKTHDTFGAANSKTFKDLAVPFSISYGSGNVSGSMGQDTLSIAGITITTSIGIATSASDDFSHFPIDGILGLSLAKSSTPHFWESLVASKALKANIFGVSLNRDSDGPNNGEINFGAPDTSRYSGSLNYYPVATNSPGDWALNMANVGFGTTQAGITGRIAYIDTGTSFIFGPPSDVKIFHALIKGASSSDGTTYTVPCSTTDSATISFGSNTYTISPSDWISPSVNGVCTSNIYGVGVVDQSSWLIGDTFLKNVYAVFDYDQTRVGFAQKSIATATSSASASSTGALTSSTIQSSTISTTLATAQATGSSNLGTQSNTVSTGSTSTGSMTGSSSTVSKVSSATGSSSTTTTGAPGFLSGHETTTAASAAAQSTSGSGPAVTPTKSSGNFIIPFMIPVRLRRTADRRYPAGMYSQCYRDNSMAKAKQQNARRDGENATDPANEEDRGLLSGNSSDDEDLVVHPGQHSSSPENEPRTPRTPNRVRFDLPPVDTEQSENGAPPPYNIEAPSVTLATSPWGDEDVHEWAERERTRPKSGLRSAFMNMANSIIGAGIIGQPYAFRQAGLLTGIILLLVLTFTVDWTIRLIVINSKLSGSNSFQGTVEHCFGKTGLIAISIAQWAFAFGGMVAFGIIVGDTIPHVMAAIFPGLRNIPVLSLLVNRRAVIVIFILGISYPLSLYRDIAKHSSATTTPSSSTAPSKPPPSTASPA